MAIAKPTASIARLRQANGNAYDASTNPGGLAEGGHRQNFVPNLNAVTDVGLWTESLAADAEAAADGIDAKVQRAENAATSAEDDARRAAASAAEAAKFDPLNFYDRVQSDERFALKEAVGGFGYGQSWQSVSRTPLVVYQNATSKPIMIVASFSGGSGNLVFQNSISADANFISVCSTSVVGSSIYTVLPPNQYFRYSASSGLTGVTFRELR